MARTTSARVSAIAAALLLIACEANPQAEPAELRAMADRVLPRLQTLAGLEQRTPVALGVRSRDELRGFVEARLAEDFPAEELEGIRAAYTAFGLLPENLDLAGLLLDLYTEQIAGFYDPVRDTLFVVEDVPPAQLETVLVHELVHALQDQHADLEALVDRSLGGDRQAAAQAAIEGHATLVMVAYAADALGVDPKAIASLPDIAEQLGPALQASAFPVLSRAPPVIRESLIFPYFGGAGFAQELWRQAAAGGLGGAPPFPAPLGEYLPGSTEQIRRPIERFFDGRDAPSELRFAAAGSGGDWPILYENTMGELGLSVALGEWLGEDAKALAYGWDGDRYVALRMPGGGVALDFALAWDDAASADAFADAYAAAARPRRAASVGRENIEGREIVRVRDVPAGSDPEAIPARAITLIDGGDG